MVCFFFNLYVFLQIFTFGCATDRLVYKTVYVKPEIIQLEKLDSSNRVCQDVVKDYEDIIDVYNRWYDQYYLDGVQ